MTEKQFKILAIVATGASILMYVTYIFQIQDNLAGHKGNPVQPFCAAINCTLWGIYGLEKGTRLGHFHRQPARHHPRSVQLHHRAIGGLKP